MQAGRVVLAALDAVGPARARRIVAFVGALAVAAMLQKREPGNAREDVGASMSAEV